MKWIAFLFLSAVICEQAVAQAKYVESQFDYLTIAPPATLVWQVATASGNGVSATIRNIPAQTFGGGQIHYHITPSNAAEFDVDFAAWQLAVNDPAFSRGIMTFGEVTQEAPVLRTSPHIELDYLRILINNYRWPFPSGGSPFLTVRALALDAPVVPEPRSLVMAAIAILVLPIRPRSGNRPTRSARSSGAGGQE